MAGRIGAKRQVIAAFLAILAIPHVKAQDAPAGAKSDPSPFAPGDLKRPVFDTQTATYSVGDAQSKSAQTTVAEVDGRAITLGRVADAIAELPPAEQRLPFAELFPRVRGQLIRQQAMVIQAQRQGMDEDPVIRRRIQAVTDRMIADAYLKRVLQTTITEQDLLARYDRDYAGRPGPEEVHLRLIMLPTEQAATDALKQLKAGSDFATLARQISRDSTSGNGGDLGWVTRKTVNAETGAIAFALPPGFVTSYPVHTAGAWFVMKVEDRRQGAAPPFAAVREEIRNTLMRERAPEAILHTLALVAVREYDITGKEVEQQREIQ